MPGDFAVMDLHHNLFYTYRGPGKDADREKQLENNVTKALINTLHLGGEAVWRPFLAWLGIADAKGADFLLQRGDLPSGHAARRRQRVLLGISKRKSVWPPCVGAGTAYESLPDAWVYGDGFAVLVESKVGDNDFSPKHMEAHLARLGSTGRLPPKIVLRTWRDVHGFLHNLLPSLTDASSLLVRQFIQFLEYNDMSGFTGFQRDHFDYFLLHDDDDARCWVRDQVEDFAARVQTQLHEFDPFYEDCHVGNLERSASNCWAAFGPGPPFKKCEKHAHQTISVSANGLRMFVNVETRPATNRLKAVIKHSRDEFRAALQKLHGLEPFELALKEVVVVGPRRSKETPKMRLHSSMLADEAGDGVWKAFAETVLRLHLLYFCIDRPAVEPRILTKLSERDAVQLVVKTFQRNHAVVKLLNG
jgi:hypothetical protein